MATKRKRRTTNKGKTRKILDKALIAGVRAGGAAATGATIGVVEQAVGERAGLGTRAAMSAVGLATEIFVDPEERPIIAEGGRTLLKGAANVTGYKAGIKVTADIQEKKREREQKELLDRLKEDLAGEKAAEEAEREAKQAQQAEARKARLPAEEPAKKQQAKQQAKPAQLEATDTP